MAEIRWIAFDSYCESVVCNVNRDDWECGGWILLFDLLSELFINEYGWEYNENSYCVN